MKNLLSKLFVVLCLSTLAPETLAQSQSVQQSGVVTASHGSVWVYNGILGDAGTSINPNISTFGIYGTGTPFCVSNTQIRTGGWYNLCLGYSTDLSAANITLTANGGASSIPLNITADGTTFPIGPNGLSALLDAQMGSTQGDVLYRGATLWSALAPGGSGTFLASNGPSNNPSWAAGTSLSSIVANTFLANTTSSTTTPSAATLPSCSTFGSFLQYTSGTGLSCASQAGLTLPTRQVLISGTTYTTPAGVRQIRILMVGGGGGGAGSGTAANNGTAGTGTSFNSITANPGGGGGANTGGAGGVASTGGSLPNVLAIPGQPGGTAFNSIAATLASPGGIGAASCLGGGGLAGTNSGGAGNAAPANSGGGGGGGGAGGSNNNTGAGGGGSAQCVQMIINSPASSYAYIIGGGGAAGAAGTNGAAGGAGGSGEIIVDEYY
jgi:hypothetical protein